MAVNKVMDSVGNVLLDLTGDTITADKVLQGYTFHDKSGNVQTGSLVTTPTGPVSKYEEDNVVRFVDYNGEIVAEYSIAEANALQALPTPPAHEHIVFECWNHTLQEVQQTTHSLCIGALYTTVDNAFYMKIKIASAAVNTNSTLNYKIITAGTFTVNWGDGTTETFTESSTGNKTKTHVYTSMGRYLIKIEKGTASLSILSSNSYAPIQFYSLEKGVGILELYIPSWQGGSDVGGNQVFKFYNMQHLEKYSVPYDYQFPASDLFYNCRMLRAVILTKHFNLYISSSSGWYFDKKVYISFPIEVYTVANNSASTIFYNINRLAQPAKKSFILPEKVYLNNTLVTNITMDITISDSFDIEYFYISPYVFSYITLSNCTQLKKFDFVNRKHFYLFYYLPDLEYETLQFDPTNTATYFNQSGNSNMFVNCGRIRKIILGSNITQMYMIPTNVSNLEELDLSAIETPPRLMNSSTYSNCTFKIKVMRGTATLYQTATNWSAVYAAGLIEEATE